MRLDSPYHSCVVHYVWAKLQRDGLRPRFRGLLCNINFRKIASFSIVNTGGLLKLNIFQPKSRLCFGFEFNKVLLYQFWAWLDVIPRKYDGFCGWGRFCCKQLKILPIRVGAISQFPGISQGPRRNFSASGHSGFLWPELIHEFLTFTHRTFP